MSATSNDLRIKLTSIAYMVLMAVCGMVLVAIGSTFEELSHQVGKDPTQLGSIFISRGIGAIIGAISCSKFYFWLPGNVVLISSLTSIVAVLLALPFCKLISQLHFSFFILGLGTSVTDTGCQLMTRRLHGIYAGPWLGANAAAFGISAALVPLLELISKTMITRYFIFSSIAFFGEILLIYVSQLPVQYLEENKVVYDSIVNNNKITPTNENSELIHLPLSNSIENKVTEYNIKWVTEILIALMLFCYVGGGVSATAYIEPYISETQVIKTNHKEQLFFLFWFMITIGRMIGMFVQRAITTDESLIIIIFIFSIGGFLSMSLVIIYPHSSLALWVGCGMYGFFHGPTVGKIKIHCMYYVE